MAWQCETCGFQLAVVLYHVRCRCGRVHQGENPPRIDYPRPATGNHWAPLHRYAVEHRDRWDATAAADWYWG